MTKLLEARKGVRHEVYRGDGHTPNINYYSLGGRIRGVSVKRRGECVGEVSVYECGRGECGR